MKLGEWQRVKQILEPALELDRASRSAFVERACAGDERLRREVESLLAWEKQAEGFLESPLLDLAARAIGADAIDNEEVLQGHSVQSDPGLAGRKVSHYQIVEKELTYCHSYQKSDGENDKRSYSRNSIW